MLDEYLALGGVELGNNARAYAYSRCLPCCVGLLKGGVCDGIHDATNDFTDAVYEWQESRRNRALNPQARNTSGWTSNQVSTNPVVRGSAVPVPHPQNITTAAMCSSTGTNSALVTMYNIDSLGNAGTLARAVGAWVLVTEPGYRAYGIDLPEDEWVYIPADAVAAGAYSTFYVNKIAGNASITARAYVTGAMVELGAGPVGPYFDGATLPLGSDPTVTRVSWAGAAFGSASILERNVVTVPASSTEPPYTCNDIQRAPWYDPDNEFSQSLAGFYLLGVRGITDSTSTATVTEGIDDGGVIGASRHSTRSVRVRTMIIGCGNAAAEYGLAWLKAALSETFCARHGDSCGTSDLAFFIDCPPPLDSADADYAATTARYRRYLHGVGTTSGPIIAEEYETPSGAYVIVVEYILTAESPFVWGQTLPVASTGDVLTAYDDIPFNLMRHPNAEVGDGIPAVTATQYVFNGSVEYGATGWNHVETNIAAGITAGASTDIAAVGPNSYRVRLLATGAVAAGQIATYYDVALGALPAGSKPSLSVWGAALIFAGAPTLDSTLTAEVEWRNGATVLSTTTLGTIPINGGNVSATGLTVPATATTARIRVKATNITAAAADDLRLYADAFSLTVP